MSLNMANTGANNKISVTLITLNEADNIEDCLKSCSWADEIVVVDSQSTDKTVELARKFTDKVFVEEWKGQGYNKNLAVQKASGPWIFSIDADERVSPELAKEIRQTVNNAQNDAYSIKRKNIYRGQWIKHGGWWPDEVKRLFLKNKASFNNARIHDSLQVNGTAGWLLHPLIHESFFTADDFLERARHYAIHQGREMFENGRKATALTAFWRAIFTFFKTFVLRAGFLDGRAGFLVANYNTTLAFYKYMILAEFWNDNKNKAGP